MIENVVNCLNRTTQRLRDNYSIPDRQGIYSFIVDSDELGKFGRPGQIIYIGLAEKSLKDRDTENHLKSGQTGWSSLRRSLGAILKERLKLKAIKRDKDGNKLRADKYKFDKEGEERLTAWMINNLIIGYWTVDNPMPLDKLRDLEEKVILKLKPTLDLDRRTKRHNLLSVDLDELRKICRDEVKSTHLTDH